MSEPKTAEEIADMGRNLEFSIESLEEYLHEHLAPKMPGGIELDSVEHRSGMRFEAYCTGLDSIRDLEAIADELGTEIGWTLDYDCPSYVTTYSIGLLRIRFVKNLTTEEDRREADERHGRS
jgi:hypothetical protein